MKKFLKNSDGVAAIEFAILLPFLLIVLYGAFQVSSYVIAIRKMDNVANDIGYILSREGFITNKVPGSSPAVPATPRTGGSARLESVFKNTIPFLLGRNYDPDNMNSNSPQIFVKYVGLPRFQDTDPGNGGCNPPSPNQDTMRLMWAHAYPADSVTNNRATKTVGTASPCVGALCVKSCSTSDGGNYKSFYSEPPQYSDRANIVFPGQAYILVNFAGYFDGLFQTFPSINFIYEKRVEKVSSYAVRSRWVDNSLPNPGDGIVQANELRNDMHYCLDCLWPSVPGGTNGMTTSGGNDLRQTCVSPVPIADRPSGGCNFY